MELTQDTLCVKQSNLIDQKTWNILTNKAHLKRMELLLGFEYGYSLLEFGPGTGILGVFLLLNKKISKYTAIEKSPKLVAVTSDMIRINGISADDTNIINADACAAPFADQTFDFVLLAEVLEHLHEPEKMLAESFRVLKKGCCGMISVPIHGAMPPGRTKGHVQDFTVDDMYSLVSGAGSGRVEIKSHTNSAPWEFYYVTKM